MEETTTRVPEVIDALVARLTLAFEGKPTAVIDGPVAAENLPEDVLVIGSPGDVTDSVTSTVQRAEGYGHRYVEVFEIHCVASTVSGDLDMRETRARSIAIFNAVSVALKADRGLGGACDLAGIGPSWHMAQAQTSDGSVCEIAFTVTGKAAL